MTSNDIAIVGGGAAGLAAAIFIRQLDPRRSVALFDGAKKLGAKILVSGGGRCNVTNVAVTERDFWGGRSSIVRQVLRRFTVADAVAFFETIGVTLHEEADGKLFPDSNRARDVLRALMAEAARVGVAIHPDHRVTGVTRADDHFSIATSQGTRTATRLVLATGGRSLPKSGSDGMGYEIARALGHTIVTTTPALAPLVLEPSDPLHGALAGVSHDATLTLWVGGRQSIRLSGALLWTHFGVSGPVALNLSRHWARTQVDGSGARVTLSFVTRTDFDSLDDRLLQLMTARPRASMSTVLTTFVPAAVAAQLVQLAELDPDQTASQTTREHRRRLLHVLLEWPLPIVDTRGYTFAEATAGGVALTEIDPATMESRVCAGLYLVGEILDVDGRIGGFNFQWAWSTAHVAAEALARA